MVVSFKVRCTQSVDDYVLTRVAQGLPIPALLVVCLRQDSYVGISYCIILSRALR